MAENCLSFNLNLLRTERNCHLCLCNIPLLPWYSNGELTPSDWAKLEYILSRPIQGGARLLLTHFPLLKGNAAPLGLRTRMAGWERLAKWGRDGRFQALLCGHIHKPFNLTPETAGFHQVDAGSISINNSFAIVDVCKNTGTITPYTLYFKEQP